MGLVTVLLAVVLGAGLVAAGAQGEPAGEPPLRFFRIGTGSTAETHFPIGGLVANAISNPPGSRECDRGGSCGVPGLIAVAQSTQGALANVEALSQGRLDAALAQADIAYWAYHGGGVFEARPAIDTLRSIATLYTDSVHLVTRRESGIRNVRDLRGKRVSLGEKGSGTPAGAGLILKAFGLKDDDIKAENLRPAVAAEALSAGRIDALFLVDAPPVPAIAELARDKDLILVPIVGPEVDKLMATYPFVRKGAIAAGTYQSHGAETPTIEMAVMLLVPAQLDRDLAYAVTKALWHPSTQKLLREGQPRGEMIRLDATADKLGIPLHPGAEAYYFDAGLVH
ncbi:MAG: TAXI family TRAP transporter solute-binding subunit [Rhodospirillales bacterium]|nr:TAXI family TRAP transporter solute-binding subunit [Rhodospirillales bacterium]